MIKIAMERDLEKISEIILKEFPYTNATVEKIKERIRNENIYVFKLVDGGKIIGVMDLELKGGVGKINAITVLEDFRGHRFGRRMLRFAVDFLKERGAGELRLIVKRENLRAKKIYHDCGFRTAGFLDRKIDGSIIEEMSFIPKSKFLNYFT